MALFKNRTWALSIALALMLSGCGQKQEASAPQMSHSETEAAPAAAAAPEEDLIAMESLAIEASSMAEAKADSTAIQTDTATKDKLNSGMFGKEVQSRQFVLTADLRFRVKDVYKSALEIENLAYSLGGFVLNNDIRSDITRIQSLPQNDNTILQTSAYLTTGELIVRLPSAKTQEFLRKLEPNIDYLDKRHFIARDVQFDILRQKLGYQRAQETQRNYGQAVTQVKGDNRIDAIDSQDRAKSIRDDAIVNQAIFEDQVAYSTINLNLYQLEKIRQDKIVDINAIIEANRPSFFTGMKFALIDGWYGVLSLLVALAAIWPLWIVVFIVGLIIRKRYCRFRNKKHQAEQNEEEHK